jgi:lipopolysaccharide export system protein LptA
MKKLSLHNLITSSLILAFSSPLLHALSTDKNQDIEIESDSVYLDDTQNMGIYSGDVVVIQGSIRITGDTLTIHYTDDNEIEKIVVEGQPATFRQLPDESTVYDEAEALIMEYHENNSLIILTNSARVKQGDRRLIAEHIEYDTDLSQVSATGAPPNSTTNQDTRVRLIIPGKKTDEENQE